MNEKAANLAGRARQKILGGKILSLQLSDQNNPHLAKILIRNFQNKRIAVIAELENETAENQMTYSLLWFASLQNLKTKSAEKIWIISTQGAKLAKLRTALRDVWKSKISIFDHHLIEKHEETAAFSKPKLNQIKTNPLAEKIIALSPEEIQLQGAKITFNGLPFAQVSKQAVYFGVEQSNRLLTDSSWPELTTLIETLRLYRQSDSPSRRHIFYRLGPEAWLESRLRNNSSLLDANLVLSPIYNQFRASSEQIDLLALRKDGRLVIIELKVAPNREHIFQAVDYWQEIEKHRLAGNLRGLFNDLEMADEPSLVYLVAPHSCFHPDFDFLASVISPDLELYRFDLNENWRAGVKVLERKKL